MKKVTSRTMKVLMALAIVFLGLKMGSMSVMAYGDDYSSVYLSTSSKTFYAEKSTDGWYYYDTVSFDVTVGGLNGKTLDYYNFDCDSEKGYWDYQFIGGNVIRFTGYRIPVSNEVLTLQFGDDWYDDICAERKITINIIGVNITGGGNSYLIKGKTKQLKVSGYSGKVTWKSSKSKVVSITSGGKVKALKEGSSLITATLSDGTKLGFIINALSSSRYKIIKKGIYIGSHWKYSQKKRMSKGYYDCSALVWKAYKAGGRKLISGSYAPTAADIGKWCVKHKKIPKGNSASNFQKMVYKPGALFFGTGAKNGRYKGIYHVEMFVGYRFGGFQNGKPIINTLWANRSENYATSGMIGQPF